MKADKFLEYLSSHLKSTVARSISLAMSFHHAEVTPLHLLYSLLEEHGSIGGEILSRVHVNTKLVMPFLIKKSTSESPDKSPDSPKATTIPEMNQKAKKMLEKSIVTAYEHSHQYVGTEHLLASLVREEDSGVAEILKELKIPLKTINDEIDGILDSTSKFPTMEEVEDIMDQLQDMVGNAPGAQNHEHRKDEAKQPNRRQRPNAALETFTVNLTNKAVQKAVDPVIGREAEIERLIHILLRRNKNNPVLIGEPGVGKTAIVEGLAKKIVLGDVPDLLKNKKIVALDLTLLVAGTIYRGEFEARLKQIIDELSNRPDYILFIDEIHNIIGAGSNQGTMDAANILKPALARGSLRCIGATTIDEYKKHISADPALERRFQSVTIDEPSPKETSEILRGVKRFYEDYHNTTISDEAVDSAIRLSVKYIHDNFLPDKAIDLIDEAAAAVRVSLRQNPLLRKKSELESKIEDLEDQKDEAISEEKLEAALKIKLEIESTKKQLEALHTKIKNRKPIRRKQVAAEDVVRVLSNRLNVPSSYIEKNDWEKLKIVHENLNLRIIGQEKAVESVIATLRQSALGLKRSSKPLASFLFAGPSGVGKTALAKTLAEEMYRGSSTLIKFDMSEFSESHSISKLLGSPAGYVGYRERNRFTDEVRRRPHSVILFDEFDKAHPDVQKLLYQILDEGELTDSQGKKIRFQHAIIILTTNVGSELFQSTGIGFGGDSNTKEKEKQIESRLRDQLGGALMARIQQTCLFHPLNAEHIKQIVRMNLSNLSDSLQEKHGVSIIPDDTAIHQLAESAHSPHEGARNVEATIEKILHSLIVEAIGASPTKKSYRLTQEANSFRLL